MVPPTRLTVAETRIVALIDAWGTLPVAEGDAALIAGEIAAARFADHMEEVDDHPTIVGLPRPRSPNLRIAAGTRLDSLERHIASRIADGDWSPGSTTDDYLGSIRAAAAHPTAKVMIGFQVAARTGRDRYLAATITESTAAGLALPGAHTSLGQSLLVLYQVGRGVVTAFMLETKEAFDRPPLADWTSFRLLPR